ncbi:hypothetical protein OG912_33575 [Streptomyces sp. NBC_00464]|uniref:hypothetical protein n=1 Tax=Streptomyces sp. NBC_00464 TaxID=2975751 RepID=UPI002E17A832
MRSGQGPEFEEYKQSQPPPRREVSATMPWDRDDAYNFALTRNGGLIGMCSAYRGAEPQG